MKSSFLFFVPFCPLYISVMLCFWSLSYSLLIKPHQVFPRHLNSEELSN